MQKIMVFGMGLVAIFTMAGYLFSNSQETQDDYKRQIRQSRKEKDELFRKGEHSPLKESDKKKFKGLDYFEIDPQYKVTARLERFEKDSSDTFATSAGKTRLYKRFGKAFFRLNKQDLSLTLWISTGKNMTKPSIFLPFTDLTSGEESYGAGRYLDMEIPQGETVEIDFNKAYNPYCAYSDDYNCPLVPRENYLSTKILAGEKNYAK